MFAESQDFKLVKSPDPRVTIKLVHNEGESLGVGFAQTIIDADLSTVVAYEFKKDSRERIAGLKKKRVVEQQIKKESNHSQLYYLSRDLGVPGLSNREYRLQCCWKREGNLVWTTYQPTISLNELVPAKLGDVLGSSTTTWLFESLPNVGGIPQTKVTFVTKNDIAGAVPAYVMNKLAHKGAKPVLSLRERFDRGNFTTMKLQRADEDTIIIQYKPKISGNERVSSRGSETATMRFKRRGEKETEVEYSIKVSFESFVSKDATKALLMARLDHIMRTVFYFNDMLHSSEVTKEDGRVMGEALMILTKDKGKSIEEVVSAYLKSNKAFGELTARYPQFIEPMMCAIVVNKLAPLTNVKGKAEVLRSAEGRLVGRSFAISLATTLTPSAAVDEWIHQFPSLQEVEREYKWFRSMLEHVGQRLVGEVGWGVKARVSIGAATSMVDLGTDLFVCYIFWKDKRMDYFEMTLVTILLSIVLQLIIIVGQNRKRGLKRMMLEALPVLVGLKPAVDAFRIACGVKEEVGGTTDALTEMTSIKCVEVRQFS